MKKKIWVFRIDDLLQKRRNSSANALELPLFCINPSISCPILCLLLVDVMSRAINQYGSYLFTGMHAAIVALQAVS